MRNLIAGLLLLVAGSSFSQEFTSRGSFSPSAFGSGGRSLYQMPRAFLSPKAVGKIGKLRVSIDSVEESKDGDVLLVTVVVKNTDKAEVPDDLCPLPMDNNRRMYNARFVRTPETSKTFAPGEV